MRSIFAVVLATVFLLCCISNAQQANLKTIKIQSSWGGLGPHGQSDLTISKRGDSYVATNEAVNSSLVDSLLKATREPVFAAPDAKNLGISAQWLRDHSDKAGGLASTLHYKEGTPEQQAMFREQFEQEQPLQARLKVAYESFHTDDYPHMHVQMELEDGKKLLLDSDCQNPFMLPWKLTENGKSTETYNADISRALYTLLPLKFTNRERLTDEEDYFDGLLYLLAQEVGSAIETRWNLLGAKQAAPDAMTQLRRNYTVRSASVDYYHNLDYGKEWTGGEPHEENLHADLWHPGLPQNLVIAAVLLHHDDTVDGVDALPKRAKQYEELIFSVPWLAKYLREHPKENSWLFYVHGESFTEKAMQIFAADMKATNNEKLVSQVRSVQHEAALLETGGGDFWIVLPDHSAILWRWQSLTHILKWKSGTFASHECTNYRTVTGGCIGTVITPDGQIAP